VAFTSSYNLFSLLVGRMMSNGGDDDDDEEEEERRSWRRTWMARKENLQLCAHTVWHLLDKVVPFH